MKEIILTLGLLHGVDIATTQASLHTGKLVEANPLQPTNVTASVAVHAGWVAFDAYLLSKTKHKRIVGGILIGIEGSVVAWNAHKLYEVKR